VCVCIHKIHREDVQLENFSKKIRNNILLGVWLLVWMVNNVLYYYKSILISGCASIEYTKYINKSSKQGVSPSPNKGKVFGSLFV
jgi:hypothetical protein